jgi:NAD-dependent DNA ligase
MKMQQVDYKTAQKLSQRFTNFIRMMDEASENISCGNDVGGEYRASWINAADQLKLLADLEIKSAASILKCSLSEAFELCEFFEMEGKKRFFDTCCPSE